MTETRRARLAQRLYGALLESPDDLEDLDDDLARHVPENAVRQVTALTLQKAGDLVVDAKTVLTWLLAALGAPASLAALLVPIRESGSMLPQAALAPLVQRRAVRKRMWVLGASLQAASVLLMSVIAATLEGATAGIALLIALSLFSLARSLSSISSKDVRGRTLPKGTRGQVTGYATIGAGVASITVGLGLRLLGGEDPAAATFAWLLAGAAVAWMLAALVFARVEEPPGEHDPEAAAGSSAFTGALRLLKDDAAFRRFVMARTLLLVSALSPPFVVTLATQQGGAGLQGLGSFVISSGIAALIGGRLWGRMADRSSRRVMMVASGLSAAVVLVFLAGMTIDAVRSTALVYPATYLLLAMVHHGSRIGRKTYVIDLAEGDQRTEYVAVSNTAMGALLLLTGAITSAIAVLGAEAALLALAAFGLAGVVASRTLPEVSAS